jgi:hypothetical protein
MSWFHNYRHISYTSSKPRLNLLCHQTVYCPLGTGPWLFKGREWAGQDGGRADWKGFICTIYIVEKIRAKM